VLIAILGNYNNCCQRNKIALGILSDRQKLVAGLADLEEIKFPMETITIIASELDSDIKIKPKKITKLKANPKPKCFEKIIKERFYIKAIEGLNLEQKQTQSYLNRVRSGEYLIKIVGTKAEVLAAKAIFTIYGLEKWQVWDKIEPDTSICCNNFATA